MIELIRLAKDTSATWTPVAVVAVLGVIATAVVGLGGLGLQLWLSHVAATRARKALRYQELIEAYAEVGRYESRVVAEISDLFEFNPDPTSKLVATRSVPETKAKLAAILERYEARHSKRMLDLHDASPEVRALLKKFQDRTTSLNIPDDATWKTWTDLLDELEDDLKAYYVAAGIDARRARIPELNRRAKC